MLATLMLPPTAGSVAGRGAWVNTGATSGYAVRAADLVTSRQRHPRPSRPRRMALVIGSRNGTVGGSRMRRR